MKHFFLSGFICFLYCNILHSQIQGISSTPVFSERGGFYTGPQSVELTSNAPGVEIRYTTDGTEPDSVSALYTSPVSIIKTTALRARAFRTDTLPGEIITQTFFIDEEINLPVISIATDPDNFFDDQTGIYITGTNGKRGDCDPTIRNLNQDWERPVNIELYEKDGTPGINQEAGIKIYGGCSRTRFPQKSLALYARKVYGKGSFNYQLFPDKPIYKFESFVLRSSADDQVSTFMRDALAQYVSVKEMDMDIQAYRPAIVFLNGVYWGIHDIREKISEHYFESNYNIDKSTVNILQSDGYASYGSASGYTEMLNFIRNNDLSGTENYNFLKTQMDIDEYIDYEILHIYLAERDWPGNNIKFWNSTTKGHEKWRWICYDLDQTFIYYQTNSLNEATATNGPEWPNPPWSTFLLRNLLSNADFKNRFIQRYAFYLNTTFRPDHLGSIVQKFRETLEPEIPRHIARWGGQLDPDFNEPWTISPTFSSLEQWLGNVNYILDFISERPGNAINHIKSKFGLTGMAALKIKTNLTAAGTVLIYDRKVTLPDFNGNFFKDVPLSVKAYPNPGYKFLRWEFSGSGSDPSADIIFSMESDKEITAVFEKSPENEPYLIINEINYNSSPDFNTGDWIEIFNYSGNTLDLSGWKLKDSNDKNVFIFPMGTEIQSKRYLTICEDIAIFRSGFPHAYDYMGNTGFGLKNEGEVINLYNSDNVLIDSVHYGNSNPWPELANGGGYSLILKSPELDNDLPENWAPFFNGSPGRNNNEVTGIPEIPDNEMWQHKIDQNYPNPCSSVTTLSYTLKSQGYVSIKVFDISGNEVLTVVSEDQSPDLYSVTLNVTSLRNGMYFYSMKVNNILTGVRKFVVAH